MLYEVVQSYICNTQVGQFIRFYNCMNLFSDIRGCHKQVGQIIRYCVKLKSHIRGCSTQVDLYQHVSHLLIKFINCNCSTGYLELAVQKDDRQFCGMETLWRTQLGHTGWSHNETGSLLWKPHQHLDPFPDVGWHVAHLSLFHHQGSGVLTVCCWIQRGDRHHQ